MTETLAWKTDGETVTLTMTPDDFDILIHQLGFAAGALDSEADRSFLHSTLALCNRLNRGNPNWMPYNIPPPETTPPENVPQTFEELLNYIERYADRIRVRDKVAGNWQDAPLSELPTSAALVHVFRWLRTGQIPHRLVAKPEGVH